MTQVSDVRLACIGHRSKSGDLDRPLVQSRWPCSGRRWGRDWEARSHQVGRRDAPRRFSTTMATASEGCGERALAESPLES